MKRLGLKIAIFILGFTVVYVFMGVSIAFVGSYFRSNIHLFFIFAGIIMIIFGLHVMHVIRIKWFEAQVGGMNSAREAGNLLGSFFVGVAFAVGWSPCTGPIVAAILTMAMNQQTVFAAGVLLLFYCLGLGIPFMFTGLAVGRFLRLFARIHRYMRVVEIVSGVLLIGFGILFLSQHSNLLRSLFGGAVGISTIDWEAGKAASVGAGLNPMAMAAALGAGLLSFISPCVLPLLPSYIAFIAGTDDLDALTGEGEAK